MVSSRKIKLSSNMKPFVSRVVRAGKVQLAFAQNFGSKATGLVGKCVSAGVAALPKDANGMKDAGQMKAIVKGCAKLAKDKSPLGGTAKGKMAVKIARSQAYYAAKKTA